MEGMGSDVARSASLLCIFDHRGHDSPARNELLPDRPHTPQYYLTANTCRVRLCAVGEGPCALVAVSFH
jgi:hypothetical protein